MKGENIVIVVGVAAVASVAGYFVYRSWERGRVLSSVRLGEDPPCAAACSEDPKCTAFAYNKTTGACTNYTTDPYTNFVEDPAWTLYVRRSQTAPPSSWSAWSPASCPTDCGDPITMHRVCSGKCPGSVDKTCERHRCPITERYEDGYVMGSEGNTPPTVAYDLKSAAECEAASTDPHGSGTWGWSYDPSRSATSCYVWFKTGGGKAPNTLSYKPPVPGKPTAASMVIPGEGNGTWGALPDASKLCKCGGPTTLERPCASGSDCVNGIRTVKCPNLCAYDTFEGGHM
jgi:hypothetical protein